MRLFFIVILFGSITFAPVAGHAHAHGWNGLGAGLCIGLPLGCLLGACRRTLNLTAQRGTTEILLNS